MSLLDNELIRKYFGCVQGDHGACDGTRIDCQERTAFRILKAMEELIKKGERYLAIYHDKFAVRESIHDGVQYFPDFHPTNLRLPDRFQEKDKICICEAIKLVKVVDEEFRVHREYFCPLHNPPPSPTAETVCACGVGGPFHQAVKVEVNL